DCRKLEAMFGKIGRVSICPVMYNRYTHETCGFQFFTMNTTEEADASIIALNTTEIMGKVLIVKISLFLLRFRGCSLADASLIIVTLDTC
ncbi:hypothetical protein BDQ17DRAFT_1233420, partial [Cyathus striatus]